MTACNPWLPTRADEALALKSPPSLIFEVQAERLPDSKPSAKITSDTLDVFVGVGVFEGVGVFVGVGEEPVVAVFVGVLEGVGVGKRPVFNKLKPSISLLVCPQVLPSKYSAEEYVQAVTLPSDVGVHTNTSSSSPETPVTENRPSVDR